MTEDQNKTPVLKELVKQPPKEVFQRRTVFPRVLSIVLLNLLTAFLLTGCFTVTKFNLGWCAWFALVPWAIALTGSQKNRRAILWAWIAGLIFWLVNLWWLTWITLIGYFALVVYMSLYWLVAGVVLRAAGKRNFPMWLCLPIVWVSLEYLRAYVISGFAWFYLAHSQYDSTRLIQICDITGQYGLSFFVAMVNGAIVDLLVSPLFVMKKGQCRPLRQGIVGVVVSVVVFVGLMVYGQFRLSQTDTLSKGPVIGIVQQSFPISLFERSQPAEKIFYDHYLASGRFVGKDCDLVVWPETMLPKGINSEYASITPDKLSPDKLRRVVSKELFVPKDASDREVRGLWRILWTGQLLDDYWMKMDESKITDDQKKIIVSQYMPYEQLKTMNSKQIDAYYSSLRQGILPSGRQIIGLSKYPGKLAKLSEQIGCPILAGGTTVHNEPLAINEDEKWQYRNSVMMFDKNGQRQGMYSKKHLVPFGETVGFSSDIPWLYSFLRQFIPPSMPQLYPGEKWYRFELETPERNWKLAAPICFEGTFPRVCRKLVMEDGKKQADILVNLSNDGWFAWKYGKGKHRRSSEHFLHLIQYCFRAVELRVPVVRSVNTGVSASIDSSGRIVAHVDARGNSMVSDVLLLNGNFDKAAKTNGGSQRVLVDSRVSLYSKTGDIFAMAVSLCAIGIVCYMILNKKRDQEK